MLPLSSTLDGTKTHHPRVDTRVANTSGIYTGNPLSLERCPLSGRSNESLPWCFRSPYRCVVKRSTRGISRRWMNTIRGLFCFIWRFYYRRSIFFFFLWNFLDDTLNNEILFASLINWIWTLVWGKIIFRTEELFTFIMSFDRFKHLRDFDITNNILIM